jgi:hypothetical protein
MVYNELVSMNVAIVSAFLSHKGVCLLQASSQCLHLPQEEITERHQSLAR